LLEIINIQPDSIAEELDIRIGDKIIAINSKQINDQIDYQFYTAEEHIELRIRRGEQDILYDIEKEYNEDLGLDIQEMKMMACGNNCVFCFVYQNPKGMRKDLYFKDEDFRFSFLYGHYVTLTTMKESDLQRVVEQNLSPLYVSVHATDKSIRKFLLGNKRNDYLEEKIKFLVDGGIELHVQIVLCPGINDGKIFDKTITDLIKFYPGVKSIAVVPLGLTRHRDGLENLRIHTNEELKTIIEYTNVIRSKIKKEIGDNFIYLADEFFINADTDLPESGYYDEFYQIENGVGEFRAMIDGFNSNFKQGPPRLTAPLKITWVTGTLAEKLLKKYIIKPLNSLDKLKIDLVAIQNDFYGPSIGVSGLLVGKDIFEQLKDRDLGEVILLPPRILNKDGLFLDDWTINDLETRLNRPCYLYQEPIHEITEVLAKWRISA